MEQQDMQRLEQRENVCCFSGHRKMPPQQHRRIAEQLEEIVIQLIDEGVTSYYAGGALGFDALASLTVLKLKERFPFIKLHLVLPCHSQTRGWRKEDVAEYEAIKASADEVTYTSEMYTRGCMHIRNRYLVDHSGICVCFLTESKSGTAYTVNYARKKGLVVLNLADAFST